MARHGSGGGGLTAYEKIAGALLFLLYIIIMPMVADGLFALLGGAFSTTLSAYTCSLIYYLFFFIFSIIVFHRYLGNTSESMVSNVGHNLQLMLTALVLFYGMNQVFYELMELFGKSYSNLTHDLLFSQVDAPSPLGWLIVVLIAPFVEEVLFRGWVFGLLKGKNHFLAYAVSICLYALMTAWAFCYNAVVFQDFSYFLPLLQVAISGWVLAWAYDKSGTLWVPIVAHALINLFAL